MEKSNDDIAGFLARTADLLELKGENQFKVRSYRTAAETVRDLAEPAASIAREGGASALQKFPGIGKSISGQIAEFVETGSSEAFERLRTEIPETVLELFDVRGVGMKMASTLYREFGILSLDDLRRFAEGGGFEAVTGLGDRTIARLVPAVASAWERAPHLPLDEAERVAQRLATALAASAPGVDVTIAGEIRRRVPEVSAIELLAVVEADGERVAEAFAGLRELREVRVKRPRRVAAVAREGIRVVLHIALPQERWVALVRSTGPWRHVRDLDERARERGIELDTTSFAAEAEIYESLGLEPVAPEVRD